MIATIRLVSHRRRMGVCDWQHPTADSSSPLFYFKQLPDIDHDA
ncbi:hypothetical protein [Halomonas sp. SpR8]|nr:hypothetical protein [Halomonas sp. SpR8]MDQ7729031.1 hypothetical protein [Halomonas sp. SpR8]